MTDIMPKLRLSTSRFGEIEIAEHKVIKIPDGLIGFPEYKRYALLDPSGGESIFLWLQSVENPDLAFILADPAAMMQSYQIETTEPDVIRLGLEQKPPPALFVIVSVPPNDPDKINANLLAPLVYLEDENTIHQIVLEKSPWPLKYYILEEMKKIEGVEQAGGTESESAGEVR